MQKLKIFTAIYDPQVNEFLEEQIETWRSESGWNREIINTSIAIHNLNIIILITYIEEAKPSYDLKYLKQKWLGFKYRKHNNG